MFPIVLILVCVASIVFLAPGADRGRWRKRRIAPVWLSLLVLSGDALWFLRLWWTGSQEYLERLVIWLPNEIALNIFAMVVVVYIFWPIIAVYLSSRMIPELGKAPICWRLFYIFTMVVGYAPFLLTAGYLTYTVFAYG